MQIKRSQLHRLIREIILETSDESTEVPSDEEDLQVQTLHLNPRNAEILKTSGAWIIMKALEDIPKLWKQIEGEFSKVSYIPTKALKTKLLLKNKEGTK